ncbi:MAG TPA: MFS transporter [Acidimicrobiales bacterium]|nr:MFS transporter [Acidimicrobiales bacterium]
MTSGAGGTAEWGRAPGFRRLVAADAISPLGDAMGTIALVLHLQQRQGTATAVATVFVAESLPPLLSPWLGALADRRPGRRLLVSCALAQAGVVAVAAATLPTLVPLFALVLLRALFGAIAAAAAGAALPALVDDDGLPAANRLLGGARELGTVFGPAAAGALFAATGGARVVLAVDALTFLVVAALVASLRIPAGPPRPATSLRADTAEGLRHLWRTPVLRALAVGFWLTVLASAADDLLLVFLASDDLEAGPAGTGVLLAAASVGLVVGLLALHRWGRRIAALPAILAGLAVMALGNLLTAAAPVLAVAFLTQALRGGGVALLDANVRTLVQRTVPRALLGRVLSNLYGGVSVAAAAGYVLGGPLLDATSPRTMFVVIGVAGLAAAGLAAVLVRGHEPGRDEGAP